jgi:hypothetical protein
MTVTQIYTILNTVIGETTGKTDLVKEDLSNIVDVGNEVFNNADKDKYVKSLLNHIGRVIFVNREYKGSAPSVLMDGWEYGSVAQKIQAELPDSTENESWELTDGETYNQDIFNAPTVSEKFFNSKVTYEIDMSFAERQVKQSFDNAGQMNSFFSMIENRIRMRRTIDFENLIRRTINNFIGATALNGITDVTKPGNSTSVKAINLLKEYNDKFTKTLKANVALFDLDFIKYAAYRLMLVSDRMVSASTLFNIGGKVRFTPKDLQHIVLLSEFRNAANVYLQSDTFHNELTKLPDSEPMNYWQGTGTTYEFDKTSTINVTVKDPATPSTTKDVSLSGILGVIFDRDALGVCNVDNRITTHYNAKAEFYNNFYKNDAQYFNDWNENFVMFYIADSVATR